VEGSYTLLVWAPAPGGFGLGTGFWVTNVAYNASVAVDASTRSGRLVLKLTDEGSTCALATLSARDKASVVPHAPAQLAMPHGLVSFSIINCRPGERVRLSMHYPGALPEGARVWSAATGWHSLDSESVVAGTIRFTITDGGLGDEDGSRNGQIEGLVGIAFGDPGAPDFQDLWWAGPAENGWGVSVVQHGAMLVPTIFAYDAAGRPTWFAMPGGSWNESHDVFTGSLYSPHGKPLGMHAGSDLVVGSPVGTASFRFSDAMNAELEMDIGGVFTHKALSRQLFGAMDAGTSQRHDDMWWAGPSQSGWGLVLQQQYSTLFGLLFTYGDDGSPTWFAMPSGAWTAADTFEGRAYRSSSSAWPKAYDATRLTSQEAGAFKLQFGSSAASFDYVLDGRPGRVTLEPLPF
jgi:hypothetical protein